MDFPNRWGENIKPYVKPTQENINSAMRQVENVVKDF